MSSQEVDPTNLPNPQDDPGCQEGQDRQGFKLIGNFLFKFK